jgi:hypothetical protein
MMYNIHFLWGREPRSLPPLPPFRPFAQVGSSHADIRLRGTNPLRRQSPGVRCFAWLFHRSNSPDHLAQAFSPIADQPSLRVPSDPLSGVRGSGVRGIPMALSWALRLPPSSGHLRRLRISRAPASCPQVDLLPRGLSCGALSSGKRRAAPKKEHFGCRFRFVVNAPCACIL